MVRKPTQDTSKETTPKQFPEVPPPSYAEAVGATYIVESMMQLQGAIGELKSDVRHLSASTERQSTKLDRISHIMFAAGTILTLVLAVGGFFLNKIWDGLVVVIKALS